MKAEHEEPADAPFDYTRPLLVRIDAIVGRAVEIPVAILTAVEIVILFAGVVARYARHPPPAGDG